MKKIKLTKTPEQGWRSFLSVFFYATPPVKDTESVPSRTLREYRQKRRIKNRQVKASRRKNRKA
jgi:hypothetical protein